MQERHDNDEIEPHNHKEYLLLYKEAEISMSGLGKFLECRKCYILLVTCALVIYLICMPEARGLRAYISGKSLMPMLQLLHKRYALIRKFYSHIVVITLWLALEWYIHAMVSI